MESLSRAYREPIESPSQAHASKAREAGRARRRRRALRPRVLLRKRKPAARLRHKIVCGVVCGLPRSREAANQQCCLYSKVAHIPV